MIQRARLVPLDSMAFDLAQHRPADRASPRAAALVLLACRYDAVDVAQGLDYAMAQADRIAAAAASDTAWARWLGRTRDAAALAVLAVLGSYGWAFLA